MAAALWQFLVFDVDGCNPGTLKFSHRSRDVQNFSKTRIGVANRGKGNCLGDVSRLLDELGETQQPFVWVSRAVGQPRPRDINRLEPYSLDNHSGKGIKDSRDGLCLFGKQEKFEFIRGSRCFGACRSSSRASSQPGMPLRRRCASVTG